jgi:hypothetical protein
MQLHLIGDNNSGKSMVLDAIALALRSGGMHAFVPEQFDFFHDVGGTCASDFSVTLGLAGADSIELPAVQGVGNSVDVHGIKVIGTRDRQDRLHLAID